MSGKTQEINGRTFAFGTIPAIEAVEVEVAIAKVIGEPMFKALVEMKSDDSDNKLSKENMMGLAVTAMGMLPAKMDSRELINTMQTVFKYVTCEGERVELNKTFTGRNKDLWVAFIAALRYNFSDFFAGSLSGSLPGSSRE